MIPDALHVTIPGNTSATVSVPKRSWEQVVISEGGTVLWQNGVPVRTILQASTAAGARELGDIYTRFRNVLLRVRKQ